MLLPATAPVTAADFGSKFLDLLRPPHPPVADEQQTPTLGPVSDRCMRCHNGDRARGIPLKTAGQPMRYVGHMNIDHPVGIDYAYFAGRRAAEFRSVMSLDEAVKLEGGKVTCIACHMTKQGFRAQPGGFIRTGLTDYAVAEDECNAAGRLTVGPTVTRLCLACHLM